LICRDSGCEITAGEDGHLKLNISKKTANINGKNLPVYNQKQG